MITNRALSLSGGDFAECLLCVPGVYAYLGIVNPVISGTLNPVHNGYFDIDESVLILGTGLYAGAALAGLGVDDF